MNIETYLWIEYKLLQPYLLKIKTHWVTFVYLINIFKTFWESFFLNYKNVYKILTFKGSTQIILFWADVILVRM